MHIVQVFFNRKRIKLLGKKPLLGIFLSTPSVRELVQMSAVRGFMRISLSKSEDWRAGRRWQSRRKTAALD